MQLLIFFFQLKSKSQPVSLKCGRPLAPPGKAVRHRWSEAAKPQRVHVPDPEHLNCWAPLDAERAHFETNQGKCTSHSEKQRWEHAVPREGPGAMRNTAHAPRAALIGRRPGQRRSWGFLRGHYWCFVVVMENNWEVPAMSCARFKHKTTKV